MSQKTITASQLDLNSLAAYFGSHPTSGIVSSVAISSSDLTVSGSPITSSGAISLTLPTVNANVGTFNSVTVNAKGQVVAASNVSSGSVTSVAATGSTGLTVGGSPITSTGTLTFTLGAELQGLSQLTLNGFVQRTGAGAYTAANLTSSQVITALGYIPVNPAANTAITGTLTFDAVHTITGLPSPTNNSDVATKFYVDSIAAGLSWKSAINAATTANLTGTYVGSPTFTLTNSGAQAAFATDGYTAALNDRILLKNQTLAAHNGIYIVTNTGSGATNWVLTRSTDFQTPTAVNGAAMFIEFGTLYSNTGWTQIDKVVTFDTDPMAFTQFVGAGSGVSSITAGTGIGASASTGAITISNTGVTSAVAGTGIGVTSATGAVTFSNTGVTSNVAGSGISVSGPTGAVTITNSGVTSLAGTAGHITVSSSTGAVTLNLATAGTAGTYYQVTTDTFGRVVSGASTLSTAALSGTLQAAQFPALTGDVTTSAGSLATTLATVNSNVGTFGSGSQVGVITVNAKGLVTGATNTAISIPATQVTGLSPSSTVDTTNAGNITSGTLSVSRLPALSATGDATGTGSSGTGSIPLTLANVNSNVGTFNNVTVNSKGLVTAASNASYVTSAVTNLAGTGNQIVTSASTGSVTLSLAPNIVIPAPGSGVALTINGVASGTALNIVSGALTFNGGAGTSGQVLTSAGAGALPTWASLSGVSVASFSGGTTGLTPSSPSAGAITLGGTLIPANGGTGLTSFGASNQVLGVNTGGTGLEYKTITAGVGITITPSAGAITITATSGGVTSFNTRTGSITLTSGDVTTALGFTPGTVSSVAVSSTTSAVSVVGSPITAAGTINITANQFTSTTPGVVPLSGGGSSNFLRADGSWTAPAGSGSVTSVGVSSANGAISVSGSPITSSGTISLTANVFTTSVAGVVPGSGGGTTNFLRADGTWAAVSASNIAAAGSTGQLQFNNLGVLAANSKFSVNPAASTFFGIGDNTSTSVTIGNNNSLASGTAPDFIIQGTGVSGTGTGGAVKITGGTCNTGTGGALSLTAGNGGTVTSGNGGALSLTAGSGNVTGTNGGSVNIAAGLGVGAGTGGSLNITTGNTTRLTIDGLGAWLLASSAGTSGQVLKSNGSGNPPTWATVTASVSLSASQIGYGNGSNALTGTPDFTWTEATNPTLTMGNTSGAAGTVTITTNPGASGTSNLVINTGSGPGTGAVGTITIQPGAGLQSNSGPFNGGNLTLQGGTAGSLIGNGSGGTVSIIGGQGSSAINSSGSVNGGAGAGASITGGVGGINGQSGGISGAGGNTTINGGLGGPTQGGGTRGAGGSLVFQTGDSALTTRLSIDHTGAWLVGGLAGTAGQQLVSNGSGTSPTWQTTTATTATNIAGGTTGEIPFQSAASTTTFDAGLTYAGSTTQTLTMGTATTGPTIAAAGASAAGPTFRIKGSTSTGNSGGAVSIAAGNAASSAQGGILFLIGGTGGVTGGAVELNAGSGTTLGGNIDLLAGPGGVTGVGGAISITGGSGGSTSGNAGNVTISGGTVTSGTAGSVLLQTASTTRLSINPTGTLTFTTSAWTVGGGTGTSGQVLTSTGSGSSPTWQSPGGGGVGSLLVGIKTADESRSSNVLANDASLQVTIPATTTYDVEILFYVLSGTAGLQFSLFGGVSGNLTVQGRLAGAAYSSQPTVHGGQVSPIPGVGTTSNFDWILMKGLVQNATASPVAFGLSWATSGGAGSTSISGVVTSFGSSYIKAVRLA